MWSELGLGRQRTAPNEFGPIVRLDDPYGLSPRSIIQGAKLLVMSGTVANGWNGPWE